MRPCIIRPHVGWNNTRAAPGALVTCVRVRPVYLLDALREMLLKVYAGQQDDGSWPQWFHFLPELISPGHRNSHGDIAYWPLLVLGEYLERTSDLDFLDEQVPFVKQRALSPRTAIRDHVLAALDYIEAHRTRDPRLPAYGHGDWNDSLQPTSASLAEQMCSTWTTELEIHSLETLANALGPVYPDLSKRLRSRAAATREGLTDVFLADGELAGYAIIGNPTMELMVHPRDERTRLHHGILQMIHAISGELLDPLDMKHHLDIIAEYLTGPMGTYLFDAPITYSGGTSHYFKRAEAATFWGREIGLMYTHAHLRFIEALTHAGRAQQAWDELKKVIPIGITNRVPGGNAPPSGLLLLLSRYRLRRPLRSQPARPCPVHDHNRVRGRLARIFLRTRTDLAYRHRRHTRHPDTGPPIDR